MKQMSKTKVFCIKKRLTMGQTQVLRLGDLVLEVRFKLSVPLFSHLQNGENESIFTDHWWKWSVYNAWCHFLVSEACCKCQLLPLLSKFSLISISNCSLTLQFLAALETCSFSTPSSVHYSYNRQKKLHNIIWGWKVTKKKALEQGSTKRSRGQLSQASRKAQTWENGIMKGSQQRERERLT